MNNNIIITGTMGSGKSSLINALMKRGIRTVPEPARDILKEQREINAAGVPEKNPSLFTQLLLSRFTANYASMINNKTKTLFDRGIPDVIAYANLFNLNNTLYKKAAKLMPYHKTVFILPYWPEIYENDSERKMTLQQALDFDIDLRKIYTDLDYNLIEVPKVSPQNRALLIEEFIS